jgi:hypothetical protein
LSTQILEDVTAPALDAAWRTKLLGVLKDLLLDDLIVDEQKNGLDRNIFALLADWATLMKLINGLRGPGLPPNYLCTSDEFFLANVIKHCRLKKQ